MSHLLQMRGLKPLLCKNKVLLLYVASFTDAWIETNNRKNHCFHILSHLLQMRGLKPTRDELVIKAVTSHLLQMRGLKLLKRFVKYFLHQSHLLQMRGLKPRILDVCYITEGRIFYRCVD